MRKRVHHLLGRAVGEVLRDVNRAAPVGREYMKLPYPYRFDTVDSRNSEASGSSQQRQQVPVKWAHLCNVVTSEPTFERQVEGWPPTATNLTCRPGHRVPLLPLRSAPRACARCSWRSPQT